MASIFRKKRSKYWYGHYPVGNGKWVYRSTKMTDKQKALALVLRYENMATGGVTSLQAQRQIAEIFANVNSGEKLPLSSIGAFLDKWVQRKKAEVSPSTLDSYLTEFEMFKRFMGPRASLDMKLLTRDDLARYRQDRMDRTSPQTARLAIKRLNVALNDAYREGLILSKIGDGLTNVKRDPNAVETRAFTEEELQKLKEAIDDPEWLGMFLFGLNTGQRLKDVAKAEWDKVDWKTGVISLFIHKLNRWQRKHLTEPLMEHLKGMRKTAQGNAIFPRAYDFVVRKDRSNVLSNQFKVFLVKAGILEKAEISHKSKGIGRSVRRNRSGVGFHSFRHGLTSYLKLAGVPHAVAQEIVGHDSKQVSQHYTHVGDEEIRKALKSFPDLLAKPAKKGKK